MTSTNPAQLPLKANIEDNTMDLVADIVFTPGEDGIITVGEDKSIRIWLRRETGQYWPSVCQFLLFSCSSAFISSESRLLFVGQDNGEVQEFSLSEDYNQLILVKKYLVHQSRITGCAYSHETQVMVACGKDSKISWHYVPTGQRLGEYVGASPFTCLQYDTQSHYVFAGMSNGEIVVLQINKNSFLLVSTLKGHEGEITCLCWEPSKRLLFSGSGDNSMYMWDIGGKKGTKIQLVGHTQRITSLFYCPQSSQLYSTSRNGSLVVWNMNAKREEAAAWQDTDHCMKCNQPFFWNLKQMWSRKTLGQRRHHCRKCGAAVCITCAPQMIPLPRHGFELEARVCNDCLKSVTADERESTAQFFDLKQSVINARPDWSRRWYATSGADRTVKIWNINQLFS